MKIDFVMRILFHPLCTLHMPFSITISGWDAGIQVHIFNFTLLSLHGENLTSSQLPAQLGFGMLGNEWL